MHLFNNVSNIVALDIFRQKMLFLYWLTECLQTWNRYNSFSVSLNVWNRSNSCSDSLNAWNRSNSSSDSLKACRSEIDTILELTHCFWIFLHYKVLQELQNDKNVMITHFFLLFFWCFFFKFVVERLNIFFFRRHIQISILVHCVLIVGGKTLCRNCRNPFPAILSRKQVLSTKPEVG